MASHSQDAGPAALVDLGRYPIHDLTTPDARALVARCRDALARTGACLLPGFVTVEATERMREEAATLEHLAFRRGVERGTAYLAPPDPALPPDHPRNHLMTTSVGAVAYDLIPRDHALRQLYEWDGLTDFLAAVLDVPRLHRYADPLGALNVAAMEEGEHLLWHFDQTDFVSSLLLRDCARGGDFEYVPMIRTRDEENYDRVRRLFDGDRSDVVRLELEPGMLVLFQGRHSIHRVTPVEGPVSRLIGLFGFDTKPGTQSTERLKLQRYGRTG